MKVTLSESLIWRGVVYLAGDREIPEELAIALNLKPATAADLPHALQKEAQTQEAPINPEVLPVGNTESTQPESNAVHGSTSSPNTVQGTKRRVKRG